MIDPAGISTDTRTIRRGGIFLALRGANYDGNCFIEDAFAGGAIGAIAERAAKVPPGRFLVRVKNATSALQDIAAYHRSKFHIPVVAVTGSNGKTTVKDMIWGVLSSRYDVLRNDGTKNNHIGVPQTLLKLSRRHDICVVELGTNHKGEIRLLAGIARPTVAVVTNVGPSHLEFLGDLEGVLKEKRDIFTAFHNGAKGLAIINGDDPFLKRIRSRTFKIKTFGLDAGNDLAARITRKGCSKIAFTVNGAECYELNLLGEHNVYNALAAIAVAKEFRVDAASISRSLARFRSSGMRLDLKKVNGFRIINDAYNSNPLSMREALNAMRPFPAVSKWVVSGDMLELGSAAAALHRAAGEMIARSGIRGLVTIGELSRHTLAGAREGGMDRRALWHCSTHDEIAGLLRRVVRKGDVVLIKGSRGMKMEKVLRGLEG